MTNSEYEGIKEYRGKVKGKQYFYTGNFAPTYLQNQKVTIESFCVNGDEHSTCEAFIKLVDGSGGQCDWIPRNELDNNLQEYNA